MFLDELFSPFIFRAVFLFGVHLHIMQPRQQKTREICCSILESVGHDRLDHSAVKAIGEKFDIDALIIGNMDVEDIKPSVDLSTILSSADVRAEVEASLTARLFETQSGATIWTNSAQGAETVAHVTLIPSGGVSFDASDPDNAYGKLVRNLIEVVTDDFWVHYRRQ